MTSRVRSVRAVVDGLHRPAGQAVHAARRAEPVPGTGSGGTGRGIRPRAVATRPDPYGRLGRADPTEQVLGGAGRGQGGVVLAAALGQPLAHLVPFDPHAAGQQQVDEQPVVLVDAHARVVGGDHGVGPEPVDDLVAGHVGGEQVVHGDGHVPEASSRPGGNIPRSQVPTASTLISLMVTQWRTRGASSPTASSAQSRKRAAASGRSQKSSPSQAGWVKWCRVTSGSRPRSRQPCTMAA